MEETGLRGNQVIHAWTRNEFVIDADQARGLGIIEMPVGIVRVESRPRHRTSYSSKSWISSGDTLSSSARRAKRAGWWFS